MNHPKTPLRDDDSDDDDDATDIAEQVTTTPKTFGIGIVKGRLVRCVGRVYFSGRC